jgi:hypothetical protein
VHALLREQVPRDRPHLAAENDDVDLCDRRYDNSIPRRNVSKGATRTSLRDHLCLQLKLCRQTIDARVRAGRDERRRSRARRRAQLGRHVLSGVCAEELCQGRKREVGRRLRAAAGTLVCGGGRCEVRIV